MGEVYGYVRVSSLEQNEDRQIIALREAGVKEDNVFIDKQTLWFVSKNDVAVQFKGEDRSETASEIPDDVSRQISWSQGYQRALYYPKSGIWNVDGYDLPDTFRY